MYKLGLSIALQLNREVNKVQYIINGFIWNTEVFSGNNLIISFCFVVAGEKPRFIHSVNISCALQDVTKFQVVEINIAADLMLPVWTKEPN